MTIKTLLATSACLAGLTIASTASAEILVQYNLDGGAPGATIQSAGTATGSNIVLGSFTNNNGQQPGFSTSSNSIFVRSSSTGNTAAEGDTLAEAITNEAYAGFTLTNDTGTALNLETLTYDHFFTQPNAAATYEIFVLASTSGFTAGNELDTLTILGADTSTNIAAPDFQSNDISSLGTLAVGDSIELRLYFADDRSANQDIFRVDNIIVNGSAVPEPGSLALLGLGGLLIARRRRRSC